MSGDFDCQKCGACCATLEEQDAWADITEKDKAALGKRFVRLHVVRGEAIRTQWKPNRAGPLAGTESCRCVALRGSIFHRVSCSIYEKRPETCRNFKPGDSGCKELRDLYSDILDENGNRS